VSRWTIWPYFFDLPLFVYPCVTYWQSVRSRSKRLLVQISEGPLQVTDLDKLFTRMCLCHQVSIIWYRPMGSGTLWLAWRKVMEAYRRLDGLKYLRADYLTPGPAQGPTFGNEYWQTLPLPFTCSSHWRNWLDYRNADGRVNSRDDPSTSYRNLVSLIWSSNLGVYEIRWVPAACVNQYSLEGDTARPGRL